ncbi:hypothetical protein [Methanococcus voltae]|uniref:Uncharacterized protein n=1 Tax=Methanococcus voltae PS TaxID=523842 RepID=A0ABT2EVP6_METVO|nr:hypothetical protein [Methanococcus voltae]MBP2173072.1 hypothetical protein [Methanococcus voltae]MCS3922037.1 hypothetical protein [Methanococcus voltae PS]
MKEPKRPTIKKPKSPLDGPKTAKGYRNKLLTGDGRKKPKL